MPDGGIHACVAPTAPTYIHYIQPQQYGLLGTKQEETACGTWVENSDGRHQEHARTEDTGQTKILQLLFGRTRPVPPERGWAHSRATRAGCLIPVESQEGSFHDPPATQKFSFLFPFSPFYMRAARRTVTQSRHALAIADASIVCSLFVVWNRSDIVEIPWGGARTPTHRRVRHHQRNHHSTVLLVRNYERGQLIALKTPQ